MNGTIIFAKSGFATAMILKKNQPVDFDYRGALKTVNIYSFSRVTFQDHLFPALGVSVSKGQTDQFYEVAIAQLIAQNKMQLLYAKLMLMLLLIFFMQMEQTHVIKALLLLLK